jgi:phosphate uptake regulator
MFLELRECLNQNNRCSEKIKIIYNTDLEVNALYFLLMKIIRKAFKDRNYAAKIGKDALELNYLHHSILNVEIIGDHIKRIAKSIPSARLKSKNIQDICLILELIEKSYKDTMTAHYTNNQEIARRVAEETREIKEKAEQLATGTKNSDIGGMSEHFKEIASRLHFISKILAY